MGVMDKSPLQSNCVQDSEHDVPAEDLVAKQSSQSSNQTACSDVLKGVVAYVDVWSSSQNENYAWAFSKQLLMMGATVSRKFTKHVTHVIFKDGLESTWQKASSTGVKLVSVLWVDNCLKSQKRLDEALYPVRCDPRTTSNYCNRKRRWRQHMCVYNLEDEDSRNKRLQKKIEKLTRQLDNQNTAAVGPDCRILAFDDAGQPVFSPRMTCSPILDRVKSMADRLQEMKARRENISLTASQMLSQSQSPAGSTSPLQCPSNIPSCSLFNILLGEDSGPGAEEMSTPRHSDSFVTDSDSSLDGSLANSKQHSTSEEDPPVSHTVVQETPDLSLLGISNAAESNHSQRHDPTLRQKLLEKLYMSDQNTEEGYQRQSSGNCGNSSELSSLDRADIFPIPLRTDSETQSSSTNIGSLTDTQSKTSFNSPGRPLSGGIKPSGVRLFISDDIQVTGDACMEETISEKCQTLIPIGEYVPVCQEANRSPILNSAAAARMDVHSEQSAATSLVFETSRKRPRIDSIRKTPGSQGSRKKQKSQHVPESVSSGIILDSISPFDDYFLPENVQELAPRNQEVINRVSALFSTPQTSVNSRRESLDGSKTTDGIMVLDNPTRMSRNRQQQRIHREPQLVPQTKEISGPALVKKSQTHSSTYNKRGVKKFRLYNVRQAGYLAEVTYTTHVERQDSPRPLVEEEKKDTDTDSTASDLCGHDASGNASLVQDIELGKGRSTRDMNIPTIPNVVEVTAQQESQPKENPLDSSHQEEVSRVRERAQRGPRRSERPKLAVAMRESENPKKTGNQGEDYD